jgi:hypothetical protein
MVQKEIQESMNWQDMTNDYPEWWLCHKGAVLFEIHREDGYWWPQDSPIFTFFPSGKKWRSLEVAKREVKKKVREFFLDALKEEV